MGQNKNGGPAFPRTPEVVGARPQFGMSLRDYFAAKAMAAIMQIEGASLPVNRVTCARKMAENAYEFADALLVAREGNNGE